LSYLTQKYVISEKFFLANHLALYWRN